MFGGEGYDGGWPWWLERVLAADGDRNTYYLVLDLMAITASSPIAANTHGSQHSQQHVVSIIKSSSYFSIKS